MTSATLKLKRRASALLIITLALSALPAPAQQKPAQATSADLARLRAHVSHLASDKLAGRRTGTPGAQEAARYVAEEFLRLGLAPGGNYAGVVRRDRVEPQQYLQEFPYVAGVELGKGSTLTLMATGAPSTLPPGTPPRVELRAGEDWMPLGSSANGRVENAPVHFMGYGVTAPELNYDDYRGFNLKGAVALVIAGTPDGDNPHGRFARAGGIRFKAAAARAVGAAALLVVATEEDFKDDRLSRLSFDNETGDAGLPVAAVSRRTAAKIQGVTPAEFTRVEGEYKKLSAAAAETGKWGEGYNVEVSEQTHRVTLVTDLVRRNAPAANVVGVLTGSDPKLREEVIVVGAHYDHLGTGGEGSLAAREGEIHHGADDNASGTAALLELARLLSAEREKMRRTVVFVAFGGEEEGLLGSNFYVNHPAAGAGQTVAMLNMDMVGRLREDVLSVGGVGTAAEWRRVLANANRGYRIKLDPSLTGGSTASSTSEAAPPRPRTEEPPVVVTGSNGQTVATATPYDRFSLRLNEDGFGPSDHASFYLKKVPVLFFFTGAHEDYHKPSDTADRINYEGLGRVLEFVREIVYSLQEADARPTFAVAQSEGAARSTGFRVYLGTLPSYGESEGGLKLEGVREGSPAAAAGLRAGDRIVKLAGRDVRNIQDYTLALSAMKAGQEYEVEIMRGTERLTLKVTPAARR